jgi:hypothetical protein
LIARASRVAGGRRVPSGGSAVQAKSHSAHSTTSQPSLCVWRSARQPITTAASVRTASGSVASAAGSRGGRCTPLRLRRRGALDPRRHPRDQMARALSRSSPVQLDLGLRQGAIVARLHAPEVLLSDESVADAQRCAAMSRRHIWQLVVVLVFSEKAGGSGNAGRLVKHSLYRFPPNPLRQFALDVYKAVVQADHPGQVDRWSAFDGSSAILIKCCPDTRSMSNRFGSMTFSTSGRSSSDYKQHLKKVGAVAAVHCGGTE